MFLKALTTGAGVVTDITLNYLPQFLEFVIGTQLSAIKVNVLGEGTICDLDAAGISSIGIVRNQGRVTNSYMVPLATGFFPGKNVTIYLTNSATQVADIYGNSDNNAANNNGMYVVSSATKALQNTGATLQNFMSAHFPNAGATDTFSITYQDGHQETNLNRIELQFRLQKYQYVSNSASDYIALNDRQTIKAISIIPAADQLVYTTQFQSPGVKFMVGNALR